MSDWFFKNFNQDLKFWKKWSKFRKKNGQNLDKKIVNILKKNSYTFWKKVQNLKNAKILKNGHVIEMILVCATCGGGERTACGGGADRSASGGGGADTTICLQPMTTRDAY